MRATEIYSHLNGLEFLQVHRPELWSEVLEVIGAVDAERCRTKVSKEVRTAGRKLFSPIDMNAEFRRLLRGAGWSESRVSYWVTKDARLIRRTLNMNSSDQRRAIEAESQTAISSYNQTDFVKSRVAIEVQFGKYAFVAYDLFVKHLAFYVGDQIDVGIEILPMKSLQANMSSGVPYYEGELYNVIRQGRGVPAVPLVLVGLDP
jgi:hypothetical protein